MRGSNSVSDDLHRGNRSSGLTAATTARPVSAVAGMLLGTIVVTALAVLAAALSLGWQPRAAFAAPDVTPELITGTGNKTCADDLEGPGQEWNELKVDPNEDGVFTDGTLTVTITNTTGDKTFDWSSNIGVDAVFVKAGTAVGSYLYRYDPPTESTGDDGLTSPGDTGNQISHIAFCYDVEAPTPTPTTTPTATPTATPTTVPTPTTAAATQAPSPTAAALAAVQLPATGGDPGSGSTLSELALVLAGVLALLAVQVIGLRLWRQHKR